MTKKIKFKEIEKMNKEEQNKKLEELNYELIKTKTSGAKSGSSRAKEIKKMIARILTLHNKEKNLGVENKK